MGALSGPDPYPADRISYTSPLNPTKVSSADDGVPDSQTPYPVAPLVLGVTITSATDPACITSPFLSPFTDTVGVNLVGQSGPTVYTPGVDGSGGSSNGNCWAPSYAQNMQFVFHDNYTIPLNDSQSSFSVNFTLYHNDLVSYQVDGQPLTLAGPLQYRPGVVYYSAPGAYLNVSAQVLPMGRVNTILSNTTEELTHLPGYGLRYTGEQEFYAFYVNLGSNAPAPFAAGTNLILESRKAFLASPASAILANATTQFSGSKLSCLGNANVTSRTTNSTPSETGIAGTFSVDLSSNSTCATTLLMELSARNSTGVTVGQNRTLSSTQIALLGLSTQVAQVAAYLPPVGFNSDPGGGPSGVLQSIVETATTYFVGALVAIGNFIAAVAKDMVALGQLILGAISKALGAVAGAARAAVAAIQALALFMLAIAEQLLSALVSPVKNLLTNYVAYAWAQLLPSVIEFNASGKVSAANATLASGGILGTLVSAALLMATAVTLVVVVIQGFSLGTAFMAETLVQLAITAALAALAYGVSVAGYGLPSGFFSSTLTSVVSDLFDGARPPAGHPSSSPGSGCAPLTWLGVLFSELGVVGGINGLRGALGLPFQSWQSLTYIGPIISLIFGVIGLFWSFYTIVHPQNGFLDAIGLAFGVAGLLVWAASYLNKESYFSSSKGILGPLGWIDLGVGASGTGVSVAALYYVC